MANLSAQVVLKYFLKISYLVKVKRIKRHQNMQPGFTSLALAKGHNFKSFFTGFIAVFIHGVLVNIVGFVLGGSLCT